MATFLNSTQMTVAQTKHRLQRYFHVDQYLCGLNSGVWEFL